MTAAPGPFEQHMSDADDELAPVGSGFTPA